jgi:hypothetical protein
MSRNIILVLKIKELCTRQAEARKFPAILSFCFHFLSVTMLSFFHLILNLLTYYREQGCTTINHRGTAFYLSHLTAAVL